jgi:hypothetical protein
MEVVIFSTLYYSLGSYTHKKKLKNSVSLTTTIWIDSTLKINQLWNETSTSNNNLVHTSPHSVASSLYNNRITTSGTVPTCSQRIGPCRVSLMTLSVAQAVCRVPNNRMNWKGIDCSLLWDIPRLAWKDWVKNAGIYIIHVKAFLLKPICWVFYFPFSYTINYYILYTFQMLSGIIYGLDTKWEIPQTSEIHIAIVSIIWIMTPCDMIS